jgi:hypothetical protein
LKRTSVMSGRSLAGPWLSAGRFVERGVVSEGGGRSAGPTDHAARATEIHVATYHEVHLVPADDHGEQSHALDSGSTNANLD